MSPRDAPSIVPFAALNQDGRKLADGTPDEVRRDPAVVEAYLGVVHG